MSSSETTSDMTNNLYIFGYGSLCWNPGFKYSDAQLGCVKGFKRRFWQGNNTHRGTEKRLGRVVTLIEDKNEIVYGKAFKVDDEKVSRSYLDNREIQLGGYTTILTTFEPCDENIKPFPVLIYIALESNEQYLGKKSYKEMAEDIISSKGIAGHNLEYLAKLAKFMRENLPHIKDDHLYLLEQMCIFILKKKDQRLLKQHFDCDSVDKKWLKRIQFELNLQPYNNYHRNTLNKTSNIQTIQHYTSTFYLSDGEELDSGESSPCLCSSDDELTKSDDQLFDSLHLNQLFNNNNKNNNSNNSNMDLIFLNQQQFNSKLIDQLNTEHHYQQQQHNGYSINRLRRNSFSHFNHNNNYDNSSKLISIKGY